MKGYKRYRAGAWRFTVDAGPDPVTGQRRQLTRTWHGLDTKAGARQADTELARFVTEIDTGRTSPTSGMTVADLIARYITDRAPGWSPGEAREVRRRADLHIIPSLGDVPIDKVRPADIKQLHAALRAKRQRNGKPLAESSIGRVHATLQAALGWAVDLELIARNPAAGRKPRVARTEIVPPTPADVARLMAAAGDELAAFLRLAALTGARRGQVCALQWRDVDFAAGSIRWTRALAKVPGGVVVKETKTGARYAVAIDPGTVDRLRRLRRVASERALAVGVALGDESWVFARDPAGRRPWHPDGASQRFAALRRQVGLEGVRLHDLRHWMATQLMAEGIDVVTLMQRGGWSNATTPLSVYSHFQPARDAEAARRLADRLDDLG